MNLPLPQQPLRPLSDQAPNVLSAALGDEESEAAILGGLMCSGDPDQPNQAFALLADLTPKSFINLKHQYIWRAMQILAQNNQPIDLVTVKNQLKLVSTDKQNFYEMVGEPYLMSLIRMQGDSPLAYKKILEYAELRRSLLQTAVQIQKIATNGAQHISKVIDQVMQLMTDWQIRANQLLDGAPTTLGQEIEELAETLLNNDDAIQAKGWDTGFRKFNEIFRGFQKGKLYLVGGMPGSGKSTLVMNFSRAFLQQEAKVLTICLEMLLDETVIRILTMESGVESHKIKETKMDSHEAARLNQAMGNLTKHQGTNHFHLKYESRPTIAKIQAIVRQVYLTSGLDALIIDYAGHDIIAPNNPGKYDPSLHMGDIMWMLKSLALELKIPVITPVQMKAAYVQRGGKPFLTDIEWSHAGPKLADGVILLEEETPYSQSLGHGCMIAHIVKNRGGQKDIGVKLESRPHLFTFNDWRE